MSFPKNHLMIVAPHYCESHRKYHNLHHVMSILEGHELHKHTTPINWQDERNDICVYLAALYHDVIYSVTKFETSNEEASAEFFVDNFSQEGMSEEDYCYIYDKVYRMIHATEHHFDGTTYDDDLVNYFLDLDLLSLSTYDISKFVDDNNNILAEYTTAFPMEYVVEKRAQFLQTMLRNFKYRILTDAHLIMKARENLEFMYRLYHGAVNVNRSAVKEEYDEIVADNLEIASLVADNVNE